MTDFGAFQRWVEGGGKLTPEARQWVAQLIRELQRKDAQIAALEARVTALETP